MKLFFILLIFPFVNGDTIVQTTSGPVKGKSLSPKKVQAFLGIPYAEPPVGSLRFSKPVAKTSWENTYNADKLPPACIQSEMSSKEAYSPDLNLGMSENCLFLNLWIPEGGKDRKPIMLFIHGGGFKVGSSNSKIYNGATLSEHGDVIVATINYRVGTLGFFYGLIDEAGGNMGLYDQVMAMQWIKDNAKNFGGDPDNIVLFGESAGGFSVSMHLASPLSKNLFKRAIIQSGTAYSPMFNENNGLKIVSEMIASHLGCLSETESLQENAKKAVDCLKGLPSEAFSKVDGNIIINGGSYYPRIGEAFLPENATDTFKKGSYKDTELLLGVTRNEGTLMLTLQLADLLGSRGEKSESVDFDETNARQFLENFAKTFNGAVNENLIQKYLDHVKMNPTRQFLEKLVKTFNGVVDENLIQEYLDRVKINPKYTYLKATADLLGDFIVTCGVIFQADYQSLKGKPAYFYVFDYRPDSSPYAEWMGVTHFDEMQYIFGNPIYKSFTESETALSKDIMDTWVAFTKTGNPSTSGMKWPQYTYKDPKYVVISKEDRIDTRPDDKRCESWRKIFNASIEKDTRF